MSHGILLELGLSVHCHMKQTTPDEYFWLTKLLGRFSERDKKKTEPAVQTLWQGQSYGKLRSWGAKSQGLCVHEPQLEEKGKPKQNPTLTTMNTYLTTRILNVLFHVCSQLGDVRVLPAGQAG